jgi:flagellin-like protein
MDRRGVSPVVATVLLIVITTVIAAIILTFVLPLVKDKLGESEACLDVFDGLEFAESQFNCFKNEGTTQSPDFYTGFSVNLKKEGIDGFRIALVEETTGSSKTYMFKKSDSDFPSSEISGVGGSSYLSFPKVGGVRSYVADEEYARGEIAPILANGQVCSVSDTIEFVVCANDVNLL